jgi:hypothetical protein
VRFGFWFRSKPRTVPASVRFVPRLEQLESILAPNSLYNPVGGLTGFTDVLQDPSSRWVGSTPSPVFTEGTAEPTALRETTSPPASVGLETVEDTAGRVTAAAASSQQSQPPFFLPNVGVAQDDPFADPLGSAAHPPLVSLASPGIGAPNPPGVEAAVP